MLAKIKRRILLTHLAKQTPRRLQDMSGQRLVKAFQRAAKVSPAYRRLLRERGVQAASIRNADQVRAKVPVLEKTYLFEQFAIDELLSEGTSPRTLASVLTSSGQGGRSFAFGMSTRRQLDRMPEDIDLGLQMAFDIDHHSSLLINCLPMGVFFSSRSVCVANVSVREDMALAIARQAGSLFDQRILCVDPLFLKRLLDHSAEQAFDWSTQRTHVILGEETFAEDYRSYVAARLGCDPDDPEGALIGSSMGVGELGLNLFFETRETIGLRRAAHRADRDAVLASYFCFNPLRCFVEIVSTDAQGVGDLVVTMLDQESPVPMIRYRTGDRARWLVDEDLSVLTDRGREAIGRLPFPIVAMLGREHDQIGADWHVDHFKAMLYRDRDIAGQLSGAFRVEEERGELGWNVQLRRGAQRAREEVEAALIALVGAMAERRGFRKPRVCCFEYADFPHGMGLDYERKFRYKG